MKKIRIPATLLLLIRAKEAAGEALKNNIKKRLKQICHNCYYDKQKQQETGKR